MKAAKTLLKYCNRGVVYQKTFPRVVSFTAIERFLTAEKRIPPEQISGCIVELIWNLSKDNPCSPPGENADCDIPKHRARDYGAAIDTGLGGIIEAMRRDNSFRVNVSAIGPR